MFFLIYRTTCLVNGKTYVGKHKTRNINDGYMGSGKLLKRAIAKYGRENFVTEVLDVFDSEEKMNLAERILVVPDRETTYNLCPGGKGGWGYISSLPESQEWRRKGGKTSSERYGKIRGFKAQNLYGRLQKHEARIRGAISRNKKHGNPFSDPEVRTRINNTFNMIGHQRGSKNSQFGTVWVSKDGKSQKISKEKLEHFLSQGYSRGRK